MQHPSWAASALAAFWWRYQKGALEMAVVVDQLCASVTFVRDRASFPDSCVLQQWEIWNNLGNADQQFWGLSDCVERGRERE